MKVKLADRIGFCFGVKRAINMAQGALAKRRVSSLGSIIHNKQVVERLSKKGLKTIGDVSEARPGEAILISSHGVGPAVYARLKKLGSEVIDTTCPFVAHAQRLVSEMARDGYLVVIVGEDAHPEVKALMGFARGKGRVVKDAAEAGKSIFKEGSKVAVISQTTQSMAKYEEVIAVLARKGPREIRIFNTICNDTAKRLKTAQKLSGAVDVMIIVGGTHSANTNRLFEVCKKVNTSYLVETEGDVSPQWFNGTRVAGIASGASTPDWVIERVVRKVVKVKGKTKNP